MVARLRTNVLKREEKGIGPVSFPRLLLSALAGVFATLTLGRAVNFGVGCISGFLVTGIVMAMTQPIGGTPLAQYLTKALRGLVVISAIKQAEDGSEPSAITSLLISALRADTEEGLLKCDEVFNVQVENEEDEDESGIVFFRDMGDLDSKGLAVVDNPFG
jgi:hypothetical protein